jgi:glycerol-3-phosphate acyltransferase PlsY
VSPPRSRVRAVAALGAAYLLGGIPWSQLAASRRRGVDLRRFGSGTVSGTGAIRSAGVGFGLAAGLADVAKGVAAPMLARRIVGGDSGQPEWPHEEHTERRARSLETREQPRHDDSVIPSLAVGAAVAGHNWSPYLRFAGGRGVAPALGGLAVQAPAGSLLLLAGLASGRLGGETAAGCLGAYLVMVPLLDRVGGRRQALAGASVVAPMIVKRLAGNAPPARSGWQPWVWRLLVDRDTAAKPAA